MIIALDIGGTKIAAARVRADGALDGEVLYCDTPATEGADAVLASGEQLIDRLDPGVVSAVAVSAAGVIDSERGEVLSATSSISAWAGTRISEKLERRVGKPVSVLGDGHAFAIGVALYGAGRGYRSVLLLAVGTGVGGGFVRAGQPLLGDHHAAGHVGHLPVPQAAGRPCPCGRAGHLEAVGGGAGILAWYRDHGGDPSVDSTRDLFTRTGDSVAEAAIARGAAAVGAGAAGLANAFDPGIVVIAGGLAQAGPLWRQPFTDTFRAGLLPILAETPLAFSVEGSALALRGVADYATRRQPR